MKIYNKTLRTRVYGHGDRMLEVPASSVEGQRGVGVTPTYNQIGAIRSMDYDRFNHDRMKGDIEIAD